MDEFPQTSETLIGKVRDPGDEDAWRRFAALYRPVVIRMGLRRGLQEADAEDVAQRVLTSVVKAIGQYEGGAGHPPFRFWLGKIATNAILNGLTRGHRSRGTGGQDWDEMLGQIPDPGQMVEKEIRNEAQWEAFRWAAAEIRGEFSSKVWQMFWSTMVEGRGIEETAADFGKKAGSVYMARFRVMKRLKEKIGEIMELQE